MSTSRLVAGLLALLCFASPARANTPSFQVIGWSADEQRFAVREYDFTDEDSGMDDSTPCPGYVDHESKPFIGSLKLSVYEKGKQLASFPIQDSGKCTSPKEARARLTKAKQAMAKLGIDLKQKQPGTELTPDEQGRITVKEGPGAPYSLETEEQPLKDPAQDKKAPAEKAKAEQASAEKEEEDEGLLEQPDLYEEVQVRYSLVVFAHKGSERRQLFSSKVEGSYMPVMGGRYYTKLDRVWLSPAGKTIVFVTLSSSGNMRGHSDSLEVLGVLSWGGEPLVLR